MKHDIKLLALLLLTDIAFMVIHVLYMMDPVPKRQFLITRDFGYAEVYQYIKEYWIIVLLLMLAIKSHCIIYFSWSLLFIYLLLDDSRKIHEKFGRYLAERFEFQPMFGLRAQDYGELSTTILFGIVLFALIGISYFFSNNIAKQVSKRLFMLVVFLAFFGVVVDMIHSAITWGELMWGLIEDGGEMLVMSIIVWYVFNLRNNPGNPARCS